MSKTILLTGGAGFIGSHVAEALVGRGDRVVIFDNFNDFLYPSAVKRRNVSAVLEHQNATLVEGDIRNQAELGRAFAAERFDAVIHLAAVAGVRPSIAEPVLYDEVNVLGTTRVLEFVRQFEVGNLVFGSSSSVYGSTSPVPFSEDQAAVEPSSPYASTKRANELACFAAHQLYGMDISCLRFFTVYGPRQRPEMAIHKFTRLIAEGREVEVFGDGSARRDYTYIDDIVVGVLAALDRPRGYRIYNLGTTDTTGLTDLVRMIGDRLGVAAKVRHTPPQPGDVPITFADISRAAAELDYRVTTPLARGLDLFVRWFRDVNQASEKTIEYEVPV